MSPRSSYPASTEIKFEASARFDQLLDWALFRLPVRKVIESELTRPPSPFNITASLFKFKSFLKIDYN